MKTETGSVNNNQEQRHNEEAERNGYKKVVALARSGDPVAAEVLGKAFIAGKDLSGLSLDEVLAFLIRAIERRHAPAVAVFMHLNRLFKIGRTNFPSDIDFDALFSATNLSQYDTTATMHDAIVCYMQGDDEGCRHKVLSAVHGTLEARMGAAMYAACEHRRLCETEGLAHQLGEANSETRIAKASLENERKRLNERISAHKVQLKAASLESTTLKAEVARLQPSALSDSNARLLSREAALKSQLAKACEAHAEAIASKDKQNCQLKGELAALEKDIPRQIKQYNEDLITERDAATRRQIKAERDAEHNRRECDRYKALCRRHNLSLYSEPELAEAGAQ